MREWYKNPLPAEGDNAEYLTADEFALGVVNGVYTPENGKGFFANDSNVCDLEVPINNFRTEEGRRAVAHSSHVVWYWKE